MNGALSTLNREKNVARTLIFVEVIFIFIIHIFIENTFQFSTSQLDYIAVQLKNKTPK